MFVKFRIGNFLKVPKSFEDEDRTEHLFEFDGELFVESLNEVARKLHSNHTNILVIFTNLERFLNL